MATGYTRTHGANARAQSWDDLPEERTQTRGNWLPLRDLDEDEVYVSRQAPRPTAVHRQTAVAPVQPQQQQPPAERTSWLRKALAQPAQAAQPRALERERQVSVRGVQARTLAMVVGGALAVLVAYLAVSAVLEWAQLKLDDFKYGRPRTVQMDAYVGHGESDGMPSHFIGMNLNRRVTVMELPGGDTTKVNTIVGPYLFGEGEDLTPVQLNAQDVNGDGKPDLVVTVKNEQLIYLNDGASFKLMSAEERAALQKAARSKAGTAAPADPAAGTGTQDGAGK